MPNTCLFQFKIGKTYFYIFQSHISLKVEYLNLNKLAPISLLKQMWKARGLFYGQEVIILQISLKALHFSLLLSDKGHFSWLLLPVSNENRISVCGSFQNWSCQVMHLQLTIQRNCLRVPLPKSLLIIPLPDLPMSEFPRVMYYIYEVKNLETGLIGGSACCHWSFPGTF